MWGVQSFADNEVDGTHPAVEDGASRRERRSGRQLVRSTTSRPDKLDRHRRIRQIRRQRRVRDRGRDEDGEREVVERATAFRTRVGEKGGQEGGEGEDAEEGPGVVAAVGGETNVGVDLAGSKKAVKDQHFVSPFRDPMPPRRRRGSGPAPEQSHTATRSSRVATGPLGD